MTWLFTVLGSVVIAAGLLEVFQTLLHPAGKGRLSRWCARAVWGSVRLLGHRATSIAGPLAAVAIILFWAVLQIVGWALIYYPRVPEGFSYSAGINEGRYGDFAEAIYASAVVLTTLGLGDVVAIDPLLRLALPFEALTGFGLLTAVVSWFMQIHPALARRRALAIRLSVLDESGFADQLADLETATSTRTLEAAAQDIVQIRVDLTQTAESYYFRESTARTSLAASLSYAVDLGRAALASDRNDVVRAGRILQGSLQDLASFLRKEFNSAGDAPEEAFAAYAASHRYPYRN
ncbi:potassium channel family protein [Arthrobacter sp. Br18]|uniref:potassium channel family protein n=1 Tax=Arthrobacter sp. Br18 TaxID=1312954 RepID=UPI00047E953D|nr:potassium channel family protein [Arthrobacter sp. Br18]